MKRLLILFLSEIQEITSMIPPKDINGNNLIELKDGKIDESRMLFVHHYTYDWDLVKSSEVIDMDKVVIPNNNALTIIFFKTDLKKEVVGFAYGNRYNNGNWTTTLGMPEYLYSEVDRLTYYLNKVKGDELIGIDFGKTFFGAKKDKGLYFEDKKYAKKEAFARMKNGKEIEDEVIKYDKDAIRKMLENRMRKFK